MISILPADLYSVISRTTLNDENRKILTMLYQPIIGHLPTILYFTLWSDLDKSEVITPEFTHHHLMTQMKLRLDDIIDARKKLEAIGLLKTYYKKGELNSLVYELYTPLTANEFLNHPILNVVLYNNVGKKEYDKIISYFKMPRIVLSDYEDITSSFTSVFESVPASNMSVIDDIRQNEQNSLNINSRFDFNTLSLSLPNFLQNDKVFTPALKELILSLVFVYNLDEDKMANLIRSVLNEKGMIDKKLLRKKARDYYQFDNTGALPTLIFKTQPEYLRNPLGDTSKRARMIYTFETTTPYDYLKSKYNGGEPTKRELHLIEDLLIEQNLKPGVVNVLIDYILRVNNQKLNKEFAYAIAGQWARLKVETVEDAMSLAEKEHKKYKVNTKVSSKTKEEIIPEWFDASIKKEQASIEEQQEIDALLKEFAR